MSIRRLRVPLGILILVGAVLTWIPAVGEARPLIAGGALLAYLGNELRAGLEARARRWLTVGAVGAVLTVVGGVVNLVT